MCCSGAATLVPELLSLPLLLTYQYVAAALLHKVAPTQSATANNTARSLLLANRQYSSPQALTASRSSVRNGNSTSIRTIRPERFPSTCCVGILAHCNRFLQSSHHQTSPQNTAATRNADGDRWVAGAFDHISRRMEYEPQNHFEICSRRACRLCTSSP